MKMDFELPRTGVWASALALALAGVPAKAGTQGAYMNSAGYGKSVSRIVYNGVTNIVSSPASYYPCSSINPQGFTCTATGSLPAGTPSTVYCQSKGFPNFVWSVQSFVTGGATADNPELESRVTVVPAVCASYTIDSTATILSPTSAIISVDATASQGAAMWLRAREFTGVGVPVDLDDLLTHSEQKAEILLTGPFNLTAGDCNAVQVPIQVASGVENLYLVVDAVAKSVPFSIQCPADLTVGCGDPVVYPPVTVTGGCGAISLSYSPSASALPAGVTPVTVTATDSAGNATSCTFRVNRQVLEFLSTEDASRFAIVGSCEAPVRAYYAGSTIPIEFRTRCNGVPYLAGTPTIEVSRCGGGVVATGAFRLDSGGEWEYNWNTRLAGKGTFKIDLTLQDGSHKITHVRLR